MCGPPYLLLPPLVLLLAHLVSALHFHLPVNSVKCLKEEVDRDVLVTGEYELSEEPRTTTNLKITDSDGYVLYSRKNATRGKFSFTTENAVMFDVCFLSRSPMGSGKVPDQLVNLIVKHGVEAKNDKELETLEKLNPLEAKMRKLELMAQSIADRMLYFKKREKEMRQTNASTNNRVLLLSVTSVVCLSALAMWQVSYLRRFFKRRKLIE
ncbi:transmembrane emp24 domain-containing protein 10-like [Nelusetta ayraudi]|uniref:transmembrane emp24 domain-containing protein 10-like n=1 Tax=Nelusetta ayraudi TaxID=303726 RepID=UPI003F722798